MDKSISQIIKEKREQLGFSIEEISEKTFIPPKFLRYIEEEKWNKFISKTHLKGFLKNYLSFLHIPVEILKQYPEIFSENNDLQTNLLDIKQSQDNTTELYYTSPKKKIIIAVVIFIIIIFCIIFFINIFKSKTTVPTILPIKKASLSHLDTSTVKPENTISFSLEATETVWVQAESNGKIIFEKILDKGQTENLKGEKISLRIGNAGGLLISYKGKTFGPFGKKGEVKDITIDKNFFNK